MPDTPAATVRSGLTRRIITGVVVPAVILMGLYLLGMFALGVRQHDAERRADLQQLAVRQSTAIAALAERLALPVLQTGTLVTLFPDLGRRDADHWLDGVLARNPLPHRVGFLWQRPAGSTAAPEGHWRQRDPQPSADAPSAPLPDELLARLDTLAPGNGARWLTTAADERGVGPGWPPRCRG